MSCSIILCREEGHHARHNLFIFPLNLCSLPMCFLMLALNKCGVTSRGKEPDLHLCSILRRYYRHMTIFNIKDYRIFFHLIQAESESMSILYFLGILNLKLVAHWLSRHQHIQDPAMELTSWPALQVQNKSFLLIKLAMEVRGTKGFGDKSITLGVHFSL